MTTTPSKLQKRDFAHTLARGLAILELLSDQGHAVSTSEAAAMINVSRAAVRRLLLTMQDLGYVDSDGRKFWLTPKVLSIGRGLLSGNSAWHLISRDVVDLADRFGEPCSVSVLDGMDIVYVCRDVTRRIYTSRLSVGDRLPAHCCASGKLLLAALDPDQFRARARRFAPLVKKTPRSTTDVDDLAREFGEIRRLGWAAADGEMEDDIVSIAVPIRDRSDAVVAAFSIASNRSRRSITELTADALDALKEAASRASRIVADVEGRRNPPPEAGHQINDVTHQVSGAGS